MIRLCIITILVLLLGCQKKENITVSNYNGIQYCKVLNNKQNSGILFKLEKSIQGNQNSCWIDIDKSGNIHVLSRQNGKIVVYDPNGSKIFDYAGYGQGPGEITKAKSFLICNDKTFINDFGVKKFHIYNQQGKFLTSISSSKTFTDIVLVKDSLFAGRVFKFEKRENNTYINIGIAIFNIFSDSIKYIGMKSHKLNDKFIEADHTPRFCAYNHNVYIAQQEKNDYRIEIYNHQGVLKNVVSKSYKAHTYSEIELKEIQSIYEDLNYTVKLKSSIKSLNIDKHGRLFVETACDSSKNIIAFDVFNNKIEFEGTAILKHDKDKNLLGNSKEFFFGDGKLYLINNKTDAIDIFEYSKK